MPRSRSARLLIVVLVAIAAGGRAVAQHQAAPAAAASHKHYVMPADDRSQTSPTGAVAPRLQNLGSYAFPVTTRNAQAQLFINQGLNLSYAFNHAEAGRAFREAARLDPDCAMAFWGQALVLGPNINATMDRGDESPAYAAIQKALALKSKASARERAYIDALAMRYTGKAGDRQAQDRAYSVAMGKVHEQFPDDLDAATLFVESVM